MFLIKLLISCQLVFADGGFKENELKGKMHMKSYCYYLLTRLFHGILVAVAIVVAKACHLAGVSFQAGRRA